MGMTKDTRSAVVKTIIIYEDKDIIVIQKPAGLATQTARIGQPDVVSELKNYLTVKNAKGNQLAKVPGKKQEAYLGIIHRLDQPVEGLLVFGKNKAAAADLTKQLSKGILNKQYYAVICGKPLQEEGELVDYLVKKDNLAEVVTGQQEQYADAKMAVLQYRALQEVTAPEHLTLMDIHIDTGRFHQIRAQMSHSQMALLGDNKYADGETLAVAQRLGVRNVALCAYSLCLQQPGTDNQLCFQVKPVGKAFSHFAF